MIRINLISQTTQLANARRRRLNAWVVSVAAAGAILAVPLTVNWLQRAEAAELADRSAQLDAELVRMRARLASVTAEASEARSHLERAVALQAKRPWSAVFAMIDRCMPQGCWLTSVATDPAAPPRGTNRKTVTRDSDTKAGGSTVVIEAPRKLRLAGHAMDAGDPLEFVTNLKGTAVFMGVTLERLRLEPLGGSSCFRFELLCEW